MERNIKLLTLLNFCTDLVFWAPVAIIYFSKVAGSYALGMSIFSVVFLASALFEVPTGIFSDRIGRKNTIIFGTLIYFVSDFLLAATHTYGFLIIAATLQGLARSFFSGNNEAFLYDTLKTLKKEQEFNSYLGKTSSVFQIALAIAAIVGSILAQQSFQLVLWVSVVPKIVMVIISFFLKEPPVRTSRTGNVYVHLGKALEEFRTNPKLKLLTTASAVRFAFDESAYQFRSAFIALLWPIWAIGIVNALTNLGAAASFYFSGKIIKKYSPLGVLRLDVIFTRTVNLCAFGFPTLFSPLLLAGTSVLYGATEVSQSTLMQQEFSDGERATQGSLGSVFSAVGFGIASVFLGAIGDRFGPRLALILAQLILFLPLFLYLKIFRIETTLNR